MSGNHAQHDQDHGIIPGVIGGTYCPCKGECEEKDRPNPLDRYVAVPRTDLFGREQGQIR